MKRLLRAISRHAIHIPSAGSASAAIEVTDPLLLYRSMVARGLLKQDPEQIRILVKLRDIHRTLAEYEPRLDLTMQFDDLGQSSSKGRDGSGGTSRFNWSNYTVRQRDKALVKYLSGDDEIINLETPKGFLLTGPPGTGKSLLMDVFFKTLPTGRKQRRHYDSFLLSCYHKSFTHLENHRLSMDQAEAEMNASFSQGNRMAFPWSRREEAKALALTKGWRSVFAGGRDLRDPSVKREFVLANLARNMIVNEGWLLAFDEFQMVDVAGASILRNLLQWFWRFGGVIIATSNRVPDDLYQRGIQREQFLGFLNILSTRCPVLSLQTPVDYRRQLRAPAHVSDQSPITKSWFLDLTEKADFDAAVQIVVDGPLGESTSISVYGRKVQIPWATKSVARFTFEELCGSALGPADYISIASRYSTIILDRIPILLVTAKNEARRFITLLDALYETKTRLLCSAAAPIEELFFPETIPSVELQTLLDSREPSAKPGAEANDQSADSLTEEALSETLMEPYRPNISVYTQQDYSEAELKDAPSRIRSLEAIDERHPSASVPAFKTLAIFSGQDERFAFRRAVSRLYEMNSAEYWQTAEHAPVSHRTWEEAFVIPRPTQSSSFAYSTQEEDPADGGPRLELDPSLIRVRFPNGRDEIQANARLRGKRDPLVEVDPHQLEPPVINENHIWGKAEWGKKAGVWGQGVGAHSKSSDKGS